MTVNVLHRWLSLRVSIHTPIQGVTLGVYLKIPPTKVSIHTPIQGVTPKRQQQQQLIRVSIHTPIQGVTQIMAIIVIRMWFQSTHPYRVWLFARLHHRPGRGFQSTHPYRVWRRLQPFSCLVYSFNPHTHTGCDFSRFFFCLDYSVSIHTPIQGVTYLGTCASTLYIGFNPHTHTGCDLISRSSWLLSKLFQSTHPYRVWPAFTSLK